MLTDAKQNLLDQYFQHPNMDETDMGAWNEEPGFPSHFLNLE